MIDAHVPSSVGDFMRQTFEERMHDSGERGSLALKVFGFFSFGFPWKEKLKMWPTLSQPRGPG